MISAAEPQGGSSLSFGVAATHAGAQGWAQGYLHTELLKYGTGRDVFVGWGPPAAAGCGREAQGFTAEWVDGKLRAEQRGHCWGSRQLIMLSYPVDCMWAWEFWSQYKLVSLWLGQGIYGHSISWLLGLCYRACAFRQRQHTAFTDLPIPRQ